MRTLPSTSLHSQCTFNDQAAVYEKTNTFTQNLVLCSDHRSAAVKSSAYTRVEQESSWIWERDKAQVLGTERCKVKIEGNQNHKEEYRYISDSGAITILFDLIRFLNANVTWGGTESSLQSSSSMIVGQDWCPCPPCEWLALSPMSRNQRNAVVDLKTLPYI